MRKQTKVVAVASAAALLAIGASMTSFAATGWTEEDGDWYYYDKDGNKVEDEWKKSGDNWYWLDSEEGGAMAIDKLIEDDDDYYYVDANGVMVKNTWVKVVNEDQDEDEDPAEYRYYYMQSNGKAYKAGDNGTKFKTIDGKRYAFDEDGKMLYGWVKEDDPSLVSTDDESWEDCVYYLGSWEDGALKTGWQKISVYDTDEDDDVEYWFNFKSNGKKRTADEGDVLFEKKINGKYYGFDERGVMTYEWTLATENTATNANAINNWRYFSNPEDGARKTKGWFKVVAPEAGDDDRSFAEYDGTFAKGDAEDENERWYYADGDGELYIGQIKKINGKYYGFAPEGNKAGSMLTGLCALTVDESGTITKLWSRNMDSDDLDEMMEDEDFDGSFYYFGNNEDEDGALKTGATTITLDGDSYNFYFSKSGGVEGKGKGWTGIDDEKYIYKYGLKIKADSDDKYRVVYASGDTGDDEAEVKLISSSALRSTYGDLAGEDGKDNGKNDDNDTIRLVGTLSEKYYLVNSSGSIVKNKTAAKDGDDWYFYVDNKQIKMYTNEKDLDDAADANGTHLKDNWDDVTVTISNSKSNLNDAPEDSIVDNDYTY